MADLAAPRPVPASRELRWMRASFGVLLGAVFWLECIALGLPQIFGGEPGYSALPLAAILGGLVGLTRGRRLLWLLATALALLIALVAYTPVVRRPAEALVRRDSIAGRTVDAVVVLSGGITTDGHLKPSSADRLLSALSLIRGGVAGTIILSREQWGPRRNPVTGDADQRRLIALLERSVPVLVVDSVFSTRDEAVRMRALATPLGITRVAVVTSPLHTRRACAAFEKVGFTVTCVPSESRAVVVTNPTRATDRVRLFQLWVYELAGRTLYRVRGWI